MKKITLLEVKEALRDSRFRDSLPAEIRPDIVKFLDNPSCACNVPLYRKLLKDYKSQLLAYFPGSEILDESKEVQKMAQNNWKVINCHINQLEAELRRLPPGRKQMDVARFQDQVTVIVNELDVIF